jgi:chromosome segregation ATPase
MFRRRSSLKQAIEQAGDDEIKAIHAEIARKQEEIAELELELFDNRSSLKKFEDELERRVRPLERRIKNLERELTEARHRAERRAQWGDRADSEKTPDVVKQFHRAWTPRAEPAPSPPKEEVIEVDQAKLRTFFRDLAKRFHPDLTPDPQEKIWRQDIMAKVNAAYAAKDLATLEELAQKPERPPEKIEKSPVEILKELHTELRRLDGVILNLKRELQSMINSEIVQLQLEASMARRAGRDLIGEMVVELKTQIGGLEAELAMLS